MGHPGGGAPTCSPRSKGVLDGFAAATGGYGFAAGVVDADGRGFAAASGRRTTAGLPMRAEGNMTVNDTFVLGSGTKPYTAAGIMRLVDRGALRLEDRVADRTQALMRSMWNTSLIELFGPLAREVTVDHLIRMQSGLADIEEVHGWERTALFNASAHDPIYDLRAVANLSREAGCRTGAPDRGCMWHFRPGNQTEYCSTNFLLAGLVLLAHRPPSEWSWRTFDQRTTLGPDFAARYPRTFFPTVGPLHKVGLSCVGNCYSFARAEIWNQDAGIMGMSWGGTTASAFDVAQFYMHLLGPGERVVSDASLASMQEWRLLSVGWGKDTKRYGAGLETNNPSPQVEHWRAPPMDHVATGIGHHGQTYGFEVLAGFYPALNASIVVTTNQDSFSGFLHGLTCSVVEAVARPKGWPGGLNCTAPRPVTYRCSHVVNASGGTEVPMCVPERSPGTGSTWEQCEAKCHPVVG